MVRWLVYSNWWVAFAAACFSLISIEFYGKCDSRLFLVLSGTFLAYSGQRWVKFYRLKIETSQEKEKWMIEHPYFFLINFTFHLVVFSVSLFSLQPFFHRDVLVFVGLSLVTLFYVFPFYRGRNLRSIPGTKIHWVGLVFTLFSIYLFHSDLNIVKNVEEVLMLLGTFLYVVGNTLFFDYRDRGCDPADMKSIPQMVSLTGMVSLGFTLQMVGILIYTYINLTSIIAAFGLIVLHGIACLHLMKRKDLKEQNYSLLFEGLMAIVGLTIYFF